MQPTWFAREEEGNICAMECFANSNHPSDVHCKDAFVWTMKLCLRAVMNTIMLQPDMVLHLHPKGLMPDKNCCILLITQDETLNEDMLMTSLSLNFTLGSLEKLPSGKIKCGKNAGQRKVFMYGNTLTGVNCKQTYDIIFNIYGQLGNETYVKICFWNPCQWTTILSHSTETSLHQRLCQLSNAFFQKKSFVSALAMR